MSDCERWMRSSVGLSAARSGAWFASTPISPVTVRVETCTTSPLKTSPSGVRTSTSKLCSSRAKRLLVAFVAGVLVAGALVAGALLRVVRWGLLALSLGLGGLAGLLAILVLVARIARAARAAGGAMVLQHLIDRALHVEGCLGNVIVLAVEDLAEAAHRLGDRHVLAG